MSQALDIVLKYHLQTKHSINAYARGPGRLDWANQPDPFRRYIGSPLIMLDRGESKLETGFPGRTPARPDKKSISAFLFNSLAISAWKSAGGSTWPLRVNPSSGNLHPTEGYLATGEIEGIEGSPGIFHYAPQAHALEIRAGISSDVWATLGMPDGTFLIVISSIHWRESWKYGERALRYSMIDVGHALAALSISASCLGWQAALIEDAGTKDLCRLLGMDGGNGKSREGREGGKGIEGTEDGEGEEERPDCLLAIFTDGEMYNTALTQDKLDSLIPAKFQGEPNILSIEHEAWPEIDNAAKAIAKPATEKINEKVITKGDIPSLNICSVIRKRRSAQAMDRRSEMPFAAFCDILKSTLPDVAPFNLFPWTARVNLALFVHRVEDIDSGLYMLVRDGEGTDSLKASTRIDFAWERVPKAPADLGLYLLAQGDARQAARQSSCRQDIASDGCFAVAMLSEFRRPLQEMGAWFYPRLYWECGMIGQSLYLGAETKGFRGCGIGCYFDDAVHEMLGLKGLEYQDLYHFTVGKAIDDPRITTLPAYEATG